MACLCLVQLLHLAQVELAVVMVAAVAALVEQLVGAMAAQLVATAMMVLLLDSKVPILNPIILEGDEPHPHGKKLNKCTYDVWQYFTKKQLVIEDNGKTYVQLWAHCDFPKCKQKGRCESNYGTTGFWTHLRVAHSAVKGQQHLKVEKDNGKDIKAVVPYK